MSSQFFVLVYCTLWKNLCYNYNIVLDMRIIKESKLYMKKLMKFVAILMVAAMLMCPFGEVNAYAAGAVMDINKGSGTYGDPYMISTLEDFEALRKGALGEQVGNEVLVSNKYFVLTADIYYDGTALSESPVTLYECKIDGQGHSINNVSANGNSLFKIISSTEMVNISFYNCNVVNAPLFTEVASNCVLSNVTVTGRVDLTCEAKDGGRSFYGALFNEANRTTLDAVNADINMTVKGNGYIGMFCGMFDGTIRNCVTSGAINYTAVYDVSYNKSLGALCGFSSGDVIDSTNNADIKIDASNEDLNIRIAGICGATGSPVAADGTLGAYVISGCVNNGNIVYNSKYNKEDSVPYVYIAGITTELATKGVIKHCENKGNITTAENYATAGIVCLGFGLLYNTKNSGDIITVNTMNTAGVVTTAMANVVNCENAGTVKGSEKRFFQISGEVAGIANELSPQYGNVVLNKCKNSGKVTAVSGKWRRFNVAGLVDMMYVRDDHTASIKNSCNCNMVTGSRAAGIVNYAGGNEHKESKLKCSVESCVNSGTINLDNKDAWGSGIVGWAENVTIKNCFNYGNIKAKNTKNDKAKTQLVWISNPGTNVTGCSIIKKPENIYPAVGTSQGGKISNTKSVTKAKMKSWNAFKNIIKNAGKK